MYIVCLNFGHIFIVVKLFILHNMYQNIHNHLFSKDRARHGDQSSTYRLHNIKCAQIVYTYYTSRRNDIIRSDYYLSRRKNKTRPSRLTKCSYKTFPIFTPNTRTLNAVLSSCIYRRIRPCAWYFVLKHNINDFIKLELYCR